MNHNFNSNLAILLLLKACLLFTKNGLYNHIQHLQLRDQHSTKISSKISIYRVEATTNKHLVNLWMIDRVDSFLENIVATLYL